MHLGPSRLPLDQSLSWLLTIDTFVGLFPRFGLNEADKTTFINLNEMYVHLQNHVIYFTVSDVSHTP